MSDTVYRVKWIDPVEMDRFESWLEHMAGKGLFFERAGFWCYTFRRGAPAEARYRLETAGRLGDGERLEYCRALGWELQGPVGERFDLFRCDDPSAPELNTDPVVQGEGLARVAEQVKWHCVLLAALTLLLLAVVLLPFSLPSWPCPVLSLVRGQVLHVVQVAVAGHVDDTGRVELDQVGQLADVVALGDGAQLRQRIVRAALVDGLDDDALLGADAFVEVLDQLVGSLSDDAAVAVPPGDVDSSIILACAVGEEHCGNEEEDCEDELSHMDLLVHMNMYPWRSEAMILRCIRMKTARKGMRTITIAAKIGP